MSKTKLSDSDIESLISDYKNGDDQKTICKKYKISLIRFKKLMDVHKVEIRTRAGIVFSKEQMNQIIQDYSRGISLETIRQSFGGISAKKIRNVLQSKRINIHTWKTVRMVARLSETDRAEIVHQYVRGASYKTLQKQFKVSRKMIESFVKEANVPIRESKFLKEIDREIVKELTIKGVAADKMRRDDGSLIPVEQVAIILAELRQERQDFKRRLEKQLDNIRKAA